MGLAWARAMNGLGEPAEIISIVCAWVASALLAVVFVVSLRRWQIYPESVHADLRHPVKHTFVSALPISMVLVSALWLVLTHESPLALEVFWGLGALGELATTIWVLSRWIKPTDQGGIPVTAITPVIFLPLVGNLLVAWAGVPFGHTIWSAMQAGLGAFLWPIGLMVLLFRVFQSGPLPPSMTPTWFILIVPPSALALSVNLWHPPGMVLWAIWGMALLSFMWALTQVKTIINQPFGLTHWGLSFPLTAFTSASLMQAQSADGDWLWAPSLVLLAVTSVVVLWLSRQTWRSLWRGEMLRPE